MERWQGYSPFGTTPSDAAVDVVRQVFTEAVLRRIAAVSRPLGSEYDGAGQIIRRRAEILDWRRPLEAGHLDLRRRAWTTYVAHAALEGLLDADLNERLVSPDDDQFRGALAECMACWFFAERLQVRLRRSETQVGKRSPDFHTHENVRVEVKAPYVPVPGNAWSGDDRAVIRKATQDAAGQFVHGTINVVLLAPLLRTPVHVERSQLVAALLGEWKLAVPIAMVPGEVVPESYGKFDQNGKMARFRRMSDGFAKPDLTRVSAVAVLEDGAYWTDDRQLELRHFVHVVHNPFVPEGCRLPKELFGEYPQLVVSGPEEMSWTDGAPIFP